MDKNELVALDIENYSNYLLIMFKRFSDGKVLYFEKFNDSQLNVPSIENILNRYTICTFNGIKYDDLILSAGISGFDNLGIHNITRAIFEGERAQPWQIRKQFGIRQTAYDHIDIMEVAPLRASLKLYAGRLHMHKMQDLPISPEKIIKESDLPLMRSYCENDLDDTIALFNVLEGELDLRVNMSEQFKVDLRSKSDAQIAEAVIKHELHTRHNITPKRIKIATGTGFYYTPPDYMGFETRLLDDLFNDFCDNLFVVNKSGHLDLPDVLNKHVITIGTTDYKIGVGGLHSMEKSVAHIADADTLLVDYDVQSYYPTIILNNNLAPKHLGKPFLDAYGDIVTRRLNAKANGDKIVADSLKITINGSFGKFASKWSFLYSPDLMMQVTVTGQLSLLMLIETLEESGVSVVSANTDGIVVKLKPSQKTLVSNIVWDWELMTDYVMENSWYSGLYSRDINNYWAVYTNGNIKAKGVYADTGLRNNPSNEVCNMAVKEYLLHSTPVEDTIKACVDIRRFVTIRTVKGGAVKDNVLIGKVIRWYYGADELDIIRYKTNGNKVPRTDGAIPLMELPDVLPSDIDYNWYITEANKLLKQIGVIIAP